jgi:UDP-glucose:(heptosyl)LPS alpha-1,3-glucosyltransferase
MYCGLPVITTENSGFAWHVNNAEAGIVVDYPFEQKQLTQAVLELLTLNLNQYKILSKNAKHYCLTEDVYNLPGAVADVIEMELFSSTRDRDLSGTKEV